MDIEELQIAFESLKIPKTHATVGLSNLIASQKAYKSLFVNRRLPETGWSDVQIQSFLYLLSTLDTNNKGDDGQRWCGVGEREGRVYSSLVAQRHFGLSHGMGRSGDITEPQPKAAGSSVLVKLTLLMALDAIRRGAGLDARGPAAHGVLLPLCTGMSMSLVLSSLRQEPRKNVVLWSRIDQKSCFKAVLTAGFHCVVVPTKVEGMEVVTDLEAMQSMLQQYEGQVMAVITTTSCFAPRVPDKVDEVAKLCAVAGVAHVINNAYGLQCRKTCKLINRACVLGRVDAIICSTDKNFMVPVGGAIVMSPEEDVIHTVGKVYAGRASSSPIVDLFITLLSLGFQGYQQLLKERNDLLVHFTSKLSEIAAKYDEEILDCPNNTISFGITVDHLVRPRQAGEAEEDYLQCVDKTISYFGAMLFNRCVSGTRVVPRAQLKVMSGQKFAGFGSSTDSYPHAYMTAACAVGVTKGEVDEFFARLDKTMKEFKKKNSNELR
jgi:O-phospho-L-seryl-tRNASec:L-selenocysteinyl-tRNA synthase